MSSPRQSGPESCKCLFCESEYIPSNPIHKRSISFFGPEEKEQAVKTKPFANESYCFVRETENEKYVIKTFLDKYYKGHDRFDDYLMSAEAFRRVYHGAKLQSIILGKDKVHFFAPFTQEERQELEQNEPEYSAKRLVELVGNTRIVMTKFPGITLESYLESLDTSSTDNKIKVIEVCISVVKAVHALHKKHGVIHGDLHLKNILIDDKQVNGMQIYLLDFDFGGKIGKKLNYDSLSSFYRAPELNDRKRCIANSKLDVYSLAICLDDFFSNMNENNELSWPEYPDSSLKTNLSKCFVADAKQRSDMKDLIRILETHVLALKKMSELSMENGKSSCFSSLSCFKK